MKKVYINIIGIIVCLLSIVPLLLLTAIFWIAKMLTPKDYRVEYDNFWKITILLDNFCVSFSEYLEDLKG